MKSLVGKNIVVFDCEIENDVISWDRKDLMGFSVGCMFDYRDGDYKVFLKRDIQEMADRMNEADLVVGFNILGFDNELIQAQGGHLNTDTTQRSWDILYHSRRSIGWDVGKQFPKGMRLDDHLLATFGKDFVKTDDGALAPKMWRDGKHSKVISYCLADVRREKMLFEHILRHGSASTGLHGERKFDLSHINKVLLGDPCSAI